MRLKVRHQGAGGFTLIELLTVMGLAGILMAIAVPQFMSLLPTIYLGSAARQVAADLQLARTRAISQNIQYVIAFTPGTGAYTFGADSRDLNQLFPGTQITAVAPANPTFNPVGTATANTTITVSNGGTTRQVQINTMGRVRVP